MSVVVSLWSPKVGELKGFLERYYQKNLKMDEDVGRWIYVYSRPLEAIDIISAVMDNADKYRIGVCIQMDKGDVHQVTLENHNDIIKGLLQLFYEEPGAGELTY